MYPNALKGWKRGVAIETQTKLYALLYNKLCVKLKQIWLFQTILQAYHCSTNILIAKQLQLIFGINFLIRKRGIG